MSRYARAQEQRLWNKLREDERITYVEYYGSRQKNRGDFLAYIGPYKLRIDHKSTRDTSGIRIHKQWLEKLHSICVARRKADGHTLPIITFNKKGRNKIFALTYVSLPLCVKVTLEYKRDAQSLFIPARLLWELDQDEIAVTSAGETMAYLDTVLDVLNI